MTEPEFASAEINILIAHSMVILHIFNCLNAKGVLPFAEAATSLRETAEAFAGASEQTKQVIQQMVSSLEKLAEASAEADPTKPPPPTRLH